jgi:hypothetical protein
LAGGAFVAAYRANQDGAVRQAVQLDALGAAILEWVADKHWVEMTATNLHRDLKKIVRRQHDGRLPIDWSSSVHDFSNRLRRLTPNVPALRSGGRSRPQADGDRCPAHQPG